MLSARVTKINQRNIVLALLFVHLGTKPPEYLLGNILRTQELFPEKLIVLLTDSQYADEWAIENNIETFRYTPDESFNQIFTLGKFDKNFRKGYWRHTIERLFAINSYHKFYPNYKILHIESDVMIMPNFPFDTFSQTRNVHWLRYGPRADIAALMYFPTGRDTAKFYSNFLDQFQKFPGSDMQVLWALRESFPETYFTFPILKNEIANTLNSKIYDVSLEQIENLDSDFSGIFDAFGIGVWLFGFDPRNRYGFTKVHTREVVDSGDIYIDASKLNFVFNKQGELYAKTCEDELIPIYNLHIHSKNSRLLSPSWVPEMAKFIELDEKESKFVSFQPKILIQLIADTLRTRNLLNFLGQLPPTKRLRKHFHI